MDVVFAHGRFGCQPDIGTGTRFVDSSGTDEIDTFAIGEGRDHIVCVGQNGEVKIGQMLNEGEGGGGGVDEDCVVQLDALRGKAGDGGLGLPVDLLPFCEGEFDAALVWSHCAAVDAEEFTAFL